MNRLKDKHKGQTAWIIGKGASLQYLKKEDIGEGPVITINQAIVAVEKLDLPNVVYSMQKNGGNKRVYSADNLCPDCKHSGSCGDVCGSMVRPKSAPLLLHEHESKYCFPDYAKRHIFDWQNLGLPGNRCSMVLAVTIAKNVMGCSRFCFVSFDAHANGDNNSYIPGTGIIKKGSEYNIQIDEIKPFIEGLDCQWITPKKRNGGLSFGVMVNDFQRLDMVLRQSEITEQLHYVKEPESATKGLNKLLDIIEGGGSDVAALVHQDMYFRNGWIDQVQSQLSKLPDDWIVAGIIGKDSEGRICGKFRDMRIPLHFNTSNIHKFPHPVCCFDEAVILVNLKSGFRFDETMEGFDLYGTLCVLQAWEMGGSAWVIDAMAEHYCMRPFTWVPDDLFRKNYKWLWDRFSKIGRIDSTAMGMSLDESERLAQIRAFMTSAE